MHTREIDEVLVKINSTAKGLSEEEAQRRLQTHGFNKLKEVKPKPLIVRFLLQFTETLTILLLIAAAISITVSIVERSLNELADAGFIFAVVLINAIIGVVQQSKADKAMQALKSVTKPYCKVMRQGEVHKIKTEELVVGDVVVLEAGDIIPADLRLIKNASIKVDESALTGESIPVEKSLEAMLNESAPIGDRHNMAYMGTVVSYGRGAGIVVATGMNTEIGKITAIISTGKDKTPLTKQVDKTSKVISVVIVAVVMLVLLLNIFWHKEHWLTALMLSIAVAVCAIPEDLPVSMTVTMMFGIQRMAKRKAIVKNLPAVETLGATEIICSDKTGTLTTNKMTVKEVYVLNMDRTTVDKQLKSEIPEPQLIDGRIIYKGLKCNPNFLHLMTAMLLCNDSEIRISDGELITVGDPTETALVHLGYELGYSKQEMDGRYPRVNEVPFDSIRKLMTTLNTTGDETIAYMKGAIGSVLPRCTHILDNGIVRPITQADISEIEAKNYEMASKALRVLAFAQKEVIGDIYHINPEKVESEHVFIGLTGMIDPPREEVKGAIATCKEAGIIPIMITGDHRDTAFAIAKELKIAEHSSQVITGLELSTISEEELKGTIMNYRVFARVSPEHKVKIIKVFKSLNKVVAMTGDGVNDAPSIKTANIGVGMGITGTDVTKEVSDIILTDDNFATIVTAVEEGRRIYSNIMKQFQFLLATGFCELIVLTILIGFMGLPFFGPALLLWINFVSDTPASLALGNEVAEKDIMKQKPIKTNKHLLRGQVGLNILVSSVCQSILMFAVYFVCHDALGYSSVLTVTMCFTTLVAVEAFHAYNLRSISGTVFNKEIFNNKPLNWGTTLSFLFTSIFIIFPITGFQSLLGLTTLNLVQWLVCIAVALLIIPMMELYKVFIRMYQKKQLSK